MNDPAVAVPPLMVRAESIRFSAADDPAAEAALDAILRPARSRAMLYGGCALIVAAVVLALWHDGPHAGEAVLFGPLVLAAWVLLLFALPGPGLAFHLQLDGDGLLLRRQARRLAAHDRLLRIDFAQLRQLEVVTHAGALQVYKGAPPMARVELLLHTRLPDFPLIRVVGMDLPVPQRWSLHQLRTRLAVGCARHGIAVSVQAGAQHQSSGAIRASWPHA